MPEIEHDNLIKEYWEKEVKDKHPEISLDACMKICMSVSEFIKKQMRRGILPFMHFKFFGKLRPMKSVIRKNIIKIEMLGSNSEEALSKKDFLTRYLKAMEDYENAEGEKEREIEFE